MRGDIDNLNSGIDAAFASRPYPGDGNIAVSTEHGLSDEANCVALFFRGKRWQDVTWDSILNDKDLDPQGFIFLLTPQAFAYYVPAFLKEALTGRAPELADSLLMVLAQPDDCSASVRRFAQVRMALFDDHERAVIDAACKQIVARME